MYNLGSVADDQLIVEQKQLHSGLHWMKELRLMLKGAMVGKLTTISTKKYPIEDVCLLNLLRTINCQTSN